jgi:predicted nucleic acid-binding protein
VILVDTSVWVEHLQSGSAILAELLGDGEVLGHPFVLGELALGNLRQRNDVLQMFRRLPQTTSASYGEVLQLIDREVLFGRGIGYVDAHLLAATRLTVGTKLWTHDRRLHTVAGQLGLAATLSH